VLSHFLFFFAQAFALSGVTKAGKTTSLRRVFTRVATDYFESGKFKSYGTHFQPKTLTHLPTPPSVRIPTTTDRGDTPTDPIDYDNDQKSNPQNCSDLGGKECKRIDFVYVDLSSFITNNGSYLMEFREKLVRLAVSYGFMDQVDIDRLGILKRAPTMGIANVIDLMNKWAWANDSCLFVIWDELQCWTARVGSNQIKSNLNNPDHLNMFHMYTGSGMAAAWKSMQDANKSGNDWFLSVDIITMPLISSQGCLDAVEAKCRKMYNVGEIQAKKIRSEAPPVAPGLVYYYYKTSSGLNPEDVRNSHSRNTRVGHIFILLLIFYWIY
jgi:hypothetical protein